MYLAFGSAPAATSVPTRTAEATASAEEARKWSGVRRESGEGALGSEEGRTRRALDWF